LFIKNQAEWRVTENSGTGGCPVCD